LARRTTREWLAVLLLATVLAGSGGAAFGDDDQPFLPNVAETRIYHGLHVMRMNRVAEEIWRRYRNEFPGVTRELLHAYMSHHDAEKLTDTHEFRERYWGAVKSGPSFAARLRKIVQLNARYKRPMAEWPEPHRSWAQSTVKELNEVGERWSMEFFRDRGLLNNDGSLGPVAKLLKFIERVADVVDRNSDRGTLREFGNREQPPLSRFLTGRALVIAERIQHEFYAGLVVGLEYDGPHAGLPVCVANGLALGLGLAL
jgi:hypothetical protein